MNNVLRKTIVASLALSVSALAGANELLNGSFEDPSIAGGASKGDAPTGWTRSTSAVGVDNFVNAQDGLQTLYFGFAANDGDESASQDVDVTGCSYYGLATWESSGWHRTTGDDTASFEVSWDVGPTSTTSGLNDGAWAETTDSGNIAHGATTATVTIGAQGVPENDLRPTVDWDNVSFEIDCVFLYSMISGKLGNGRGSHSFDGAFGILESINDGAEEEAIVGTVDVNYKDLGYSCTYTPVIPLAGDTDPDFIVWGTTYECDDDDTSSGEALFVMFEGGGGPEGQGKDKDRGCVIIEADDAELDVEDCLNKGNVDVLIPEL